MSLGHITFQERSRVASPSGSSIISLCVGVGEMFGSLWPRPYRPGAKSADSSLCQGGITLLSSFPAVFWHETIFDSVLSATLSFAVLPSLLIMLNNSVFTEHLGKNQAHFP